MVIREVDRPLGRAEAPAYQPGHLLSEKKKNSVLFGVIIGVLTFWLFSQSTVNIGPTIGEELGLSSQSMGLMVSLASFVCGMTIVGIGNLADRFGCLRVLTLGNLANIAGSLILAFTPTGSLAMVMTVFARSLQGLSGAAIMSASLGLVGLMWSGSKRSRAVSMWSIGSWGGAGFCAAFAGFVTTSPLGWRGLFVASAVASIASIIFTRPAKAIPVVSKATGSIDYRGMLLFALVIGGIQVLISYLSVLDSFVLAAILVAVLALSVVLKGVERNAAHPLIDTEVLKNRAFSSAGLINFLISATGGSTAVALWVMQDGFNLSVAAAGTASIGFAVGVVACIRVGEILMRLRGARTPIWIGGSFIIASVLLMMLTVLPQESYVPVVTIGFILYGIGVGLCATPTTDTAVANVDSDKSAVGGGMFKMTSSLGMGLGTAISTALYTYFSDYSSVYVGGTIALLFSVLCTLGALVINQLVLPKHEGKAEVTTGNPRS